MHAPGRTGDPPAAGGRRDRAGIGGDDRFVVIEETELAGDGLDALAL
jgi:hypothetical protein